MFSRANPKVRYGQTDRQTDRQADRQKERRTDRQTEGRKDSPVFSKHIRDSFRKVISFIET